MPGPSGNGPSRGSLRVQAWIYGVINPLLKALEVELHLLERKDLTWAFIPGQLEQIGDPASYLVEDGKINLSDMLRALQGSNPPVDGFFQLRDMFTRHAARIADLERAAATYQHALLADERFGECVDRAVREYLTEKPSIPPWKFHPQPWGAFPPDKLKELVAENLVNHLYELRSSRTDGAFWKFFLHRGYGAEIARLGAPSVMSAALDQGTQLAAHEAKELVERLEQLRAELCDAYDLPAAPAPMLGAADHAIRSELLEQGPARRGIVSLSGERVGVIEETVYGSQFSYDSDYLDRRGAIPISATLPLRSAPYQSAGLHPFFANLLPEGGQLEIVCRKLKLDPSDRFGVLLATCMDTIGAVEVRADPGEPRS